MKIVAKVKTGILSIPLPRKSIRVGSLDGPCSMTTIDFLTAWRRSTNRHMKRYAIRRIFWRGIGLRAIVEAVCEEKAATGSDLIKRIDDLIIKGVTTQSGASILHNIRLMGNASAHEVKANSEEELTTALEVVEHLLLGVYLIPQKAAKLKKK